MPAAAYQFTGYETIGYQDYRDTGTGKMLVAGPGGSYGIVAIDPRLAVPPPDGRWLAAENAAAAPWEPPPSPPPVPEVPAVPSADDQEEAVA